MGFGTVNLASKFASKVDERFDNISQASLVTNKDFDFNGVKSINIYSLPVTPLNDYTRSGSTRYGTANDLGRNIQTMTITQDKSFTAIIDKGDKLQSMGMQDAGKYLARETNEVIIPTYDKYVFDKIATRCKSNADQFDNTTITTSNAYGELLKAQEYLGDMRVPDKGRVLLASYEYCTYLMQDPAFIRYGNASQEMLNKGVIGEVDGLKITRVASSKLPRGCQFMLTHPYACVAPKQLDEYKVHENVPGISGWLIEGRMIYDAFILEEKGIAMFYHGGSSKLARLSVIATAVADNGKKYSVVVGGAPEGTNTFKYVVGAEPGVVTASDVKIAGTSVKSSLAALTASNISGTAGQYVTVVEVDGSGAFVAAGSHKLMANDA